MKLTGWQQKQLKAVELEILLEIDRVCRECEICYFLDSGTLLGAVRHAGFIPWDDDIDIGMLRKDYDRFLKLAPQKLGTDYYLQSKGIDKNTTHSFAKVRKNRTRYVEYATQGTESHQGIWVDIFPFDAIDGHSLNVRCKKWQWAFFHRLFSLRVVSRASNSASWPKRTLRWLIRLPLLMFPESWFYKKLDVMGDDVDPEKGYLACFHYFSYFVAVAYEIIFPVKFKFFEGYLFPVPNDYEEYLRVSYGDWRELPPEGKRIPNHDVCEIEFGDQRFSD